MQIVGMSIMMKVAYVWCSAYIVGLSFPKFFRWGREDGFGAAAHGCAPTTL